MLTQAEILRRAEAYACCALARMHAAILAWDIGDTKCGDENFELAEWLGLFAAPTMYAASGDDFCGPATLPDTIAEYADCICSPCECEEPAPTDCTITPDFTVLDAVAQADLPVSPADGDSYYILSGTNVGQIATWKESSGIYTYAAVPTNSIVFASETGLYYTNLGSGPGLLFPNPVLTQVLGAFWAVTTNSPQTEDGRQIQLQGLGPNGWYNLTAPYAEGSPYPTVNLTGLVFTDVRFKYILANGCEDYSGNGTFIPPVVPPLPCTITPDFSVSMAVDANQQGLTGDGYFFIAKDQYGMGNEWAANVGSIVTVIAGLYTYSPVAELQTVYAIDTLLYWRIIGGQPAPLFPSLTATQTASPTGYFLESDWINASAAGDRFMIVEALISSVWTIVWNGYEYDLPQQLPDLGPFDDLRVTYLINGCAYEVPGTAVTPDILTVETDCAVNEYLFYRYRSAVEGNTSWLFHTTSPGETLTLLFIAGGIDPAAVITIYDGQNNSAPPLMFISGVTDLATITVASTQEYMYMEVSDGATGMTPDMATWWWQVGCTSGATSPTATVNVTEKCDEYQICLSVDVTSLGDSPTINIEYSVDGGVPAVISDIDTLGPVSLGCFDYLSTVVVTLIYPDYPLANVVLGAFTGSGACENPCAPEGASKIDQAGDLADLPTPPPLDPWRYLVVSDVDGLDTFLVGEVLEYNAGVWSVDTSLPGVYSTDIPLQYWQTAGAGVQPYPLLPYFFLNPTGNSPNNFALSCPDVAAFAIPTNQPFSLQVRLGNGPWTEVHTGTLQQVIVPNLIPITTPFTSARVVLNYLTCGIVTGVQLGT